MSVSTTTGDVVFAAIVPHGALAVPTSGRDADAAEARLTQQAYLTLSDRLRAARADRVVVLTPHNVHVEGHFAVIEAGRLQGGLADWGNAGISLEAAVDRPFSLALVRALREAGLPALGVSYGGNDGATATHPLDWATLIPLWYLGGRFDEPLPAVVATPSRDRSPADHLAAGRVLAEVARRAGGRTALIASCDHGHGHRESGPYGFRPESAVYDDRVMDLLRRDRLDEVAEIDPGLVRDAAADSWWQMLMLAGALGPGWHADLLSYEHPTYFGMAVCDFTRPAGE